MATTLAPITADPSATKTQFALEHIRAVLEDPSPLHISWGVRCFNGAYDGKTSRVLDAREKLLASIRIICPEARTCYYPAGAFHVGFDGLRIVTNDRFSFESCLLALAEYAIKRIEDPSYTPTISYS